MKYKYISIPDILYLCSLHFKLVQLLKMYFDHTLNIFIHFDPEIPLSEIWFKEIVKIYIYISGKRCMHQCFICKLLKSLDIA